MLSLGGCSPEMKWKLRIATVQLSIIFELFFTFSVLLSFPSHHKIIMVFEKCPNCRCSLEKSIQFLLIPSVRNTLYLKCLTEDFFCYFFFVITIFSEHHQVCKDKYLLFSVSFSPSAFPCFPGRRNRQRWIYTVYSQHLKHTHIHMKLNKYSVKYLNP